MEAGSGRLTLKFNTSLLGQGGGDPLVLQPYNRAAGASKLHVLVNASLFCMQTAGGGGASCIDDGHGKPAPGSGFEAAGTWVAVDMALSPSTPHEVQVDLSKAGGVAFAIRYAWQGDCCSEDPPHDGPCPLASCPLMGGASRLPANPFVAKVLGGKCACLPPQKCDA